MDHDTQILSESDWIIEMGPGAGADGGLVIAEGTPAVSVRESPLPVIGPFLSGAAGAPSEKAGFLIRNVQRRKNPAVHIRDPYGKASESGDPERKTDRQ